MEIPYGRDELIQGQSLQDDNQLPPVNFLDEYWPDTAEKAFHVIIKLPEPGK